MQDIIFFIQNHSGLVAALITALTLLMFVEFVRQKIGAKRLSPSEVIHFINRKDAVVIDIRSKEIFNAGHIAGAQSIPINEFKQKSAKLESFKNKPIILVCGSGLESNQAANLLIQKGINSYILDGGIKNWRSADLPLIKG